MGTQKAVRKSEKMRNPPSGQVRIHTCPPVDDSAMIAAIEVRKEGVGRNRGAGRINNKQYVRNEVYVCAWDGMHVQYTSTILASLTWVFAAMSAPFSKSREQMSLRPLKAALCNAVWPNYNNRETETERDKSGQGPTEEDGHGAGAGGQGTVGPVRVG